MAGEPLDGRAARVAEAEETGDLVKSLAGGVIYRLAKQDVLARCAILHQDQHRVTARDQKYDHWQRQCGVFEESGV